MNKATAIVFPAPDNVELQTYDIPDPQPDELLVRTEYSGVSQGTEIWALSGQRPELKFPTVPGYQSIGRVESVGEKLAGKFKSGQRVFYCTSRLAPEFPETWMGAHVSHALVKDALVVAEETDPVAASLSALAAVSLRGIRMLDIHYGDLVVVTGQGLIGQGSAQLAKAAGAVVVATDIHAPRLGLSRKFSADVTVNVKEEDLGKIVRGLREKGADAVIETTGRSDQFAPCIDLLRREGQLLLQGWYPKPIAFDFHTTHLKKPTVAITCGMDLAETALCLELMRWRKLNFRELVTDLAPVASAPDIYRRMLANDPDILGAVFDWSGVG